MSKDKKAYDHIEEEQVFVAEQACEYLRTTRVTLYKLIKEEKIPAAKVGRSWRILKSEINNYLRGGKKGDKNGKTD